MKKLLIFAAALAVVFCLSAPAYAQRPPGNWGAFGLLEMDFSDPLASQMAMRHMKGVEHPKGKLINTSRYAIAGYCYCLTAKGDVFPRDIAFGSHSLQKGYLWISLDIPDYKKYSFTKDNFGDFPLFFFYLVDSKNNIKIGWSQRYYGSQRTLRLFLPINHKKALEGKDYRLYVFAQDTKGDLNFDLLGVLKLINN